MERKNTDKRVFIDSSGLKAVFDRDDDFNKPAIVFWNNAKSEKIHLYTSNFILDETYTLIRSHMGKEAVFQFRQDLAESIQQIRIFRIMPRDEVQAWIYFEKLPGRGISFTDCTSFAVMKRLGMESVFTFDEDFKSAGFKMLPQSLPLRSDQ